MNGDTRFHQLLAFERPPAVVNAVRTHLQDAIRFKPDSPHPRWDMDSATNYDFLRFGNGREVLQKAIDRLSGIGGQDTPTFKLLDVGAGSGGFVALARDMCAEAGIRLFARGVTGGFEAPEPADIPAFELPPENPAPLPTLTNPDSATVVTTTITSTSESQTQSQPEPQPQPESISPTNESRHDDNPATSSSATSRVDPSSASPSSLDVLLLHG